MVDQKTKRSYNNSMDKGLLSKSSLTKTAKTEARDLVREVRGWFDHLKSSGLLNNSLDRIAKRAQRPE